jgi:hypothetical protein
MANDTKIVNGVTIELTDEEQAERVVAKKTWDDGETNRKWASIRASRDIKLMDSDWMANSDVTMSDAWKTYRQALRDLPASKSNPDDITWPTPPE